MVSASTLVHRFIMKREEPSCRHRPGERGGAQETGADMSGSMHARARRRPRRELVRVGAVGAALGLGGLLVGCSPSADTGPEDVDELGTEPESIHETAGLGLSAPESGTSAGVLVTAEGLYRLGAVGVVDRLSATVIEDRLSRILDSDEDVVAPEGEAFLMASISVESVHWQTASAASAVGTAWVDGGAPPSARIVVTRGGEEISTGITLWTSDMAWLMRVPADPAPADAVLEVEMDGRIQRLSLVDGSLISTDLPDLYGRSEVAAHGGGEDDVADLYLDAEDEHGSTDSVVLAIRSVWTTPLSDLLGWAEEGRQHLAVGFDTEQRMRRGADGAIVSYPMRPVGCTAAPDGEETAEPLLLEHVQRTESYGRYEGDSWTAWFSVPSGFETAQVTVGAEVLPRREGLAEALGIGDGLRITVTGAPTAGGAS